MSRETDDAATRVDDGAGIEDDATQDADGAETADPPTWGDLFARGEAVDATTGDVRETLRGRRDD